MKNLLCLIGIHRPLIIEDSAFVDRVSGKMVFHARCSCGKKWLTDSFNKWFGYRMEKKFPKGFYGYECYGHPDKHEEDDNE